MNPTIELVSWTQRPIETIYKLWIESRKEEVEDAEGSMENIEYALRLFRNGQKDHPLYTMGRDVDDTFRKVVDAGIPVAENVSFTFLIHGISIGLREQMVRHRIGVKAGEQLGVDIVPDLADSTWWSQSMRILDMGAFADNEAYLIPDGISELSGGKADMARKIYKDAMQAAALAYNKLVSLDLPMEDARNVIPLAATHRISWTLNLASLKHIVGKRGCWILQLGIWKPVIVGMIEELANKVDPYFRSLITPPCLKGNTWVGCKFGIDNERRMKGEDNLPPCALYLNKEIGAGRLEEYSNRNEADVYWNQEKQDWRFNRLETLRQYRKMSEEYKQLWGRSLDTGELIDVNQGKDSKASGIGSSIENKESV